MMVSGITYRGLLSQRVSFLMHNKTENPDLKQAIRDFCKAYALAHDGHSYDLSKLDVTASAVDALKGWLWTVRIMFSDEVDEMSVLERLILKVYIKRNHSWMTELEKILEDLCLLEKEGKSSSVTHLRAL